MKVCILTTAFPRWPGDERAPFIYEAAKALKNAHIDVCVIAMHRPGTREYEDWDGIEIFRARYLPDKWEILQEEGGGIPVVWKNKPLARLALLPFMVAQSIALLRHARDCDIIHANWTLSGFTAWMLRPIHRRPFIVTIQGSDIYQGAQTGWIRFLTKACLDQADAVVALSNDLANSVNALGVHQKTILVIPNGTDTGIFKPGLHQRENFILFVGSLIPRKGCKFLIQSFKQISKKYPDIRLILVGIGPDELELKNLVYELGLGDKIQFLGSKTREEISSLMQRAKLFVLPSLEEGLGVVLLEAIACGTPCVASKVGGIPDVITEQVGRLVSPGDPQQIANAVIEIIENPGLWQKLSQTARDRAVSVFDWEVIAIQLKQLYSRIFRKPIIFSE